MQRETLPAVEHAATLPASILQAGRRLTADRGNQVVGIADDRHRLRLLLDVLDLDLLLLLLLGGLLLGLLLGSCGGGGGLLLSLLLRLLLRLSLRLCLRLLLLNHGGGFIRDDGGVGRVRIQSAVHQTVVSVQFRFRSESFAASQTRE